MIIQLLDKWVEIEIESTVKGTIGTPKETYIHLKNTWSGIQFTGGGTQGDGNGENAATDAIFTIRYDERVNYKCRFKYMGQTYKITHIEPIGRKEGIRCKTINFFAE